MSIKKQVQAFYAKQGLQGKHLRKAIQWDLRRIRRLAKQWAYFIGTDRHGDNIADAFVWEDTREGFDYWCARHDACRSSGGEVAVSW